MNTEQYKQYEQSVAQFMKDEGVNCLTQTTETGAEDAPKEAYFSSVQCDVCGSTLAGDRYECSGYNPETKEIQDGYEVCTDCLYYSAYGELDDDTMMGLEKGESD